MSVDVSSSTLIDAGSRLRSESPIFADLPARRRVHSKDPGVHFRSLACDAARPIGWGPTMNLIG